MYAGREAFSQASDAVASAACLGTILIRAQGCALRVDNGILRPLGNSTKRRTNWPALSTTYLVPPGRRFGMRYVLRTFGPYFSLAGYHQATLFVRIATKL